MFHYGQVPCGYKGIVWMDFSFKGMIRVYERNVDYISRYVVYRLYRVYRPCIISIYHT